MAETKHPSHVTRFSFDASTFDEICTKCGHTDQVPGGWGKLAEPCPATEPHIFQPTLQWKPGSCDLCRQPQRDPVHIKALP